MTSTPQSSKEREEEETSRHEEEMTSILEELGFQEKEKTTEVILHERFNELSIQLQNSVESINLQFVAAMQQNTAMLQRFIEQHARDSHF